MYSLILPALTTVDNYPHTLLHTPGSSPGANRVEPPQGCAARNGGAMFKLMLVE